MKIRTLIVLGLVASLSGLAACGDSKEAKTLREKMGDTWDAVKKYGAAQSKDFSAWIQGNMPAIEQKIASLKEQAASAGRQVTPAVEQKWGQLKEAMKGLEGTTGDQWVKARDAVTQAYEALKRELGL